MTYTPPAIADEIFVGSSAVLVAGTASVGGSGTLQNTGQQPLWYGTQVTVTPSTGTQLNPGDPAVQLASGTNYYCITQSGAPTVVLVTTWTSNIPGSSSGSGSSLSPLISVVGQQASGSWSAATTTTVSLNSGNCPMNSGDLVLVAVDEFLFNGAPPTISSISDTNGNTWSKIANTATSAVGSIVNVGAEIWRCIVSVAGATTVTLHISSATGSGQVAITEFTKSVGSAWNIDVSGTGSTTTSTSGTNSIAFPALTPTSPFEMYIGVFGNTGSPGTAAYPSGYSVSYPFVYNTNVSSAQTPAVSTANNVIWATVGVCIGVFAPTGNATQLQGTAVSNTTPTTNQILAYNGTNWAPAAAGSGNATSIQGTAVSVTTPTNTQVLTYNGTNWAPATPSTSNATSIQSVAVSATAPTSGQVLGYNGTNWLPTTPSSGGTGEPLAFNTVASATGTLTIANPTSAQINWYTLAGNLTLTMPALASGDWFWLWVDQPVAGSFTLSWSASPALRWVGGTAPTQPGAGLRLLVGFQCDGTSWLGTLISNGF